MLGKNPECEADSETFDVPKPQACPFLSLKSGDKLVVQLP